MTFQMLGVSTCLVTISVFSFGCQGSKQYFGLAPSETNTGDTTSETFRPDTNTASDRASDPDSASAPDSEPSDTENRSTDTFGTDSMETEPSDTEETESQDTGEPDTVSDDSDTWNEFVDTNPPDSDDTSPDAGSETTTDDAGSDPLDTDTDYSDTDTDTAISVDTDEHLDTEAIPTSVPEVQIEINDVARDILEATPFNGPDVVGVFVDETGRRYDVQLNYRGAYALQGLINTGSVQRNWKVKFAKTDKYQNRREWNFNYEPSVRQKLAYDLFKFAGVKMPSPRHVRMVVNGEDHGVYLEWEDPDSKDWLWDRFGDDEGDLYKAAYDIPDEPKYFADLTYLGDTDADYFYHYDKKTNNDKLPDDYSMLRGFVYDLNFTPDEAFVDWLSGAFTFESFITYLAVSNFISNWDGYPQRPKNYWLYNNPTTTQWTFIPWDLDNTFQTGLDSLNQMGTDASIFYQFDEFEPYGLQEGEGTERPLVRRMMVHPEFREAYIARYKELMTGVLDPTYIADRAARLTELVLEVATEGDKYTAQDAEFEIQEFVARRHENVTAQLSAF